jgi:exodeoxyribonuclease VII small subunit
MNDPPEEPLSFEEALAQLEQIVRELEDGQTGLEESLERYEAGVHLIKRCYQQLTKAEQRILLLTGVDRDGKPTTVPFEHEATGDRDKMDGRRNKPLDSDTMV